MKEFRSNNLIDKSQIKVHCQNLKMTLKREKIQELTISTDKEVIRIKKIILYKNPKAKSKKF